MASARDGERNTNNPARLSLAPPQAIKLSVVIPVYNERLYIEEILRRVQEIGVPKEIITVDDCSADGTREWLLGMAERQAAGVHKKEILDGRARLYLDGIRFLFQQRNCGKGAALRRGLATVGTVNFAADPVWLRSVFSCVLDGLCVRRKNSNAAERENINDCEEFISRYSNQEYALRRAGLGTPVAEVVRKM